MELDGSMGLCDSTFFVVTLFTNYAVSNDPAEYLLRVDLIEPPWVFCLAWKDTTRSRLYRSIGVYRTEMDLL